MGNSDSHLTNLSNYCPRVFFKERCQVLEPVFGSGVRVPVVPFKREMMMMLREVVIHLFSNPLGDVSQFYTNLESKNR